jgi:hypothetical protein
MPPSRRDFIKQASALAVSSILPGSLPAQNTGPANKIWAGLLHLSFNMWEDHPSTIRPFRGYKQDLEFDEPVWEDAVSKAVASGMNMIVIDLGDAVRYESHPEIAVKNAWTPERLRTELAKLRKAGLEPIPKLNFSATHDAWMKEYSRMVSTPKYYSVCANLIREVSEIFDTPRFFHLGLDEESFLIQRHYNYIVIRQNEYWWNDFYFLVDKVQESGARPWIWSDCYWHHPEIFLKKMPKSVIQSNWYYGSWFDDRVKEVRAYHTLDHYGYDQIPTTSNCENKENTGNTIQFAKSNLNDRRLLGFLQTFWRPTIEQYKGIILEGIEQMGDARKKYYGA